VSRPYEHIIAHVESIWGRTYLSVSALLMEADCWQRTTGWRRFEFGRLDPGGAMSEDLCVSEQAHSSHARTVVEDELP
jgi:hypothetical protein